MRLGRDPAEKISLEVTGKLLKSTFFLVNNLGGKWRIFTHPTDFALINKI
jgi:hypothetical protein